MSRISVLRLFSLRRLSIAAAACIGCLAGPAAALTCTVATQSVAFGSYNTLEVATVHGVGHIDVSCDSTVSYAIALSQGSGSYAVRTMTNGTAKMQYNLYTSSLRTTIWGDGSGSTATVAGSGTGNHAVYGGIPGGQNLPAGTYSDQLIVTVTY